MGYSAYSEGSNEASSVGVRLTGLALYCSDCKRSFYHLVRGTLRRVNENLIVLEDSSHAPIPWDAPPCRFCASENVWLWEII